MTTIAWDGKQLAADRCSWSRGVRRAVRKVFKVRRPHGQEQLVALVGDAAFAMRVLHWLQHDGDAPKPKDYDVEPGMVCAVVIDPDGTVWELSATLTFLRMEERTYALGAGCEFAWGALEAGASAQRAVEIAAARSDFSALGVDTVEF